MCGLWGFEKQSSKDKVSVDILGFAIRSAQQRGGHGDGIYFVNRSNEATMLKTHSKLDVDQVINLVAGSLLCIGHSRLSTGSDLKMINQQPIITPELIICHNGVIPGAKPFYTENDSEDIRRHWKRGTMNRVPGAYLALEVHDYHHTLLSGSDGLIKLFTREHENVKYYSSKAWQ